MGTVMAAAATRKAIQDQRAAGERAARPSPSWLVPALCTQNDGMSQTTKTAAPVTGENQPKLQLICFNSDL